MSQHNQNDVLLSELVKRIESGEVVTRDEYDFFAAEFDGSYQCLTCGELEWETAKCDEDGNIIICNQCIGWPDGNVRQ